MHLAHNLQSETCLRGHRAQRLPDGVFIYLHNQLSDAPKLLQPERPSAAKHAVMSTLQKQQCHVALLSEIKTNKISLLPQHHPDAQRFMMYSKELPITTR